MRYARPFVLIHAAACLLAVGAAAAGPVPQSQPAGVRAPARTAKTDQRFWVFFADKGYEDEATERAAIADVERGYNPRAVERRRLRRSFPGLFDARDLPVSQSYLDAVTGAGAKIHLSSRWLNAASVVATPAQLRAISALPFVTSVEPVRRGRGERLVQTPPPDGHGNNDFEFYGYSHDQLAQINLIGVHDQGFTGQGVVVGILDTGFLRTHEAYNDPDHPLQVVAEHDFVMGDGNTAPEAGDADGQYWHGSAILGVLGAYKPGTLVGGAYNASFILCKTEDIASETPVEEDNYAGGLEFIEANGGDMATASLIYVDWYSQSDLDGQTAISTIAVNVATGNGLYCCNAAGNYGHDEDPATSRLGAPADALQVLTCGAADINGFIADFSSDGPSADGREKPEVLACGVGTVSIDPDNPVGYGGYSGTSLSTPMVACAVACLAGAHPEWTVDHMRERLMTTASDFVQNGYSDPLFVRGHGIIDAAAALNEAPPPCYADCDQSTGAGVLDLFDFLCFQNAFIAQDAYADCDQSTGPGVFDLFDFLCYVNGFNEGC